MNERKPYYIFMDEPTAGLDSETLGNVLDLFNHLKKNGIIILLVDHHEGEIEPYMALKVHKDYKDKFDELDDKEAEYE